MSLKRTLIIAVSLSLTLAPTGAAQTPETIFDDNMLLNGYTERYQDKSNRILLAMINDETLSPYKMAAAVRVFRKNFAEEIFGRDKKIALKALLRRFARTNSSFVRIEIMHTLCTMDRYKYFKAMIPSLIQEFDHYNTTVNDLAYAAITEINKSGTNRPREARIIFNTLRRRLYASRRKLQSLEEPGFKLKRELELLRWSIKILGNEELKRLPLEAINLL